MDVGGGLGVDYDGSQTDFESSINYTLQEYANDVVFRIKSVCDEAGVPHPDHHQRVGPELVAHSVLVFNVRDIELRQGGGPEASRRRSAADPGPVYNSARLNKKNYVEGYDSVGVWRRC